MSEITLALQTDIGQKRSENQDYIANYTNQAHIPLVVLADGMGGHRAGNVASQLATETLGATWEQTDLTDLSAIRRWLTAEIEAVNQLVHTRGQEEAYRGMGTTIEAIAIVGTIAIFAHVGDSRIGRYHEGQYQQLTNDHSLVNELVQAGQLTEEEALNHPQKNIITQSIGQASPVTVDIGVEALEVGDILVANSDGLTNMVMPDQIVTVLAGSGDLNAKAQTLVALANQAGGLDNISVALIQVESEGQV